MYKIIGWHIILFHVLLLLFSCTNKNSDQQDVINDVFPERQAELRAVIESIVNDAETANLDGLTAAHLFSAKFSKFGPRNFNRQDVQSTNRSESEFFGTISDYKQEIKDLKIDIFDEIGIATYYPNISFRKDGKLIEGSGRQTLVFLKTTDGWKIIHEHGTPKK